jgi:hypothetical protein
MSPKPGRTSAHITYLERQRHQDNKRIAQLQVQTTELSKKISAGLQDSTGRAIPPRLGELENGHREIRQQQSKEVERVQLQDAQRERQIKSWLRC